MPPSIHNVNILYVRKYVACISTMVQRYIAILHHFNWLLLWFGLVTFLYNACYSSMYHWPFWCYACKVARGTLFGIHAHMFGTHRPWCRKPGHVWLVWGCYQFWKRSEYCVTELIVTITVSWLYYNYINFWCLCTSMYDHVKIAMSCKLYCL